MYSVHYVSKLVKPEIRLPPAIMGAFVELRGVGIRGRPSTRGTETIALAFPQTAMARLRRDTQETVRPDSFSRTLRVAACGTLFLTHTLDIPSHPEPATVVRAHSVTRSRGGSAATCSSIIAQFPSVDAMLIAPLGGNEEGQMILRDLERERVNTRYCKVWEQAGVPSAWVLHAGTILSPYTPSLLPRPVELRKNFDSDYVITVADC